MYDPELLQKLLEKEENKVLKEVFYYCDPTERLMKLLSIREQVDKTAYGMYVRYVIQMNTHGIPLEMMLDALKGLKQEDLMCKEELDKLEEMPEILTIYRGTDAMEYPPRISWSLLEKKARCFQQGQMFKAAISKYDIFAYFSNNCSEEEILAYVTDNFDDIF